MGPGWKVWQAIRELYCNAIDEEDGKCFVIDEPHNHDGRTEIWIDAATDEVMYILDNWDNFFSAQRVPILTTDKGEVFRGKEKWLNIFRKGIKCNESSTKSLYDYNLFDVRINESRVLRYEYERDAIKDP